MLLFILMAAKFLYFSYVTGATYSPWLIAAIDCLILSGFWMLASRREKPYRIATLSIYFVLSLLLFADIVYFSYFNRLPSVRELGHAGNLGDVTDAILLLIKWKTAVVLFDLPVVGYLFARGWLHAPEEYLERKASISTRTWPQLLFCVALLTLILGAGRIPGVSRLEFFTYHALDFLGAETAEEEAPDEEETLAMAESILNPPKETNEYTGIAKGKNVIVIQVESLNNFVIGRSYNGEEITPCLNRLISEKGTIYASDYYEMLGAGNTSDAEFVSLHSLYPSMKNPSYEVYMDTYVHGLPKILKEHGYVNTAFHNYKRDFWVRDRAYPHIGFERFVAEDNFDLDEVMGMGLSDGSFFRQSLPMIQKMQQPFFSFLVTLTSHIPYEMPASEQKIPILPEDQGSIFGNYINAIHYTDSAIGAFIDGLKQSGLYDKSVIAIYGDHHGINETVKADTERIAKLTGKPFDYDTMLNIPLVLHVGGMDKTVRVDEVASQIDLTPTLLNLLGIERRGYILFGSDIFSKAHPHTLFPQSYMLKGSFIDDAHIFTMSRDGIFENGTLKDRSTGKRIDSEPARVKYREALGRINLCKRILEENRIEELMEKAKAGKEIDISDVAERAPLGDAVRVRTARDIAEAYRQGYKTMWVELEKTRDGYFAGDSLAELFYLDRLPEDVLTLGSVVGGEFPDDLRFILKTRHPNDLADVIRSLPGLYRNILLQVDGMADYPKVANKQNGFGILYRPVTEVERAPEKLESMAETNPDLYFLDAGDEKLEGRTLHSDGTTPALLSMEAMRAFRASNPVAPTRFVRKAATPDQEVEDARGRFDWNSLLHRQSEVPLVVTFRLDPNFDQVSIGDLPGDRAITSETIADLLEANPKLVLAVDAPQFTVEVLRNLLKHHPDLERIYPILHSPGQISFAKKMGYTTCLLESDLPTRVVEELRRLWKVGRPIHMREKMATSVISR